MIFPFSADEHAFRTNTEKQKKMAGVMLPQFKCNRCHQYRRISGRKKNGKGWMCSHCVTELAAKVAA